MITKDNLKTLLLALNFEQSGNQYSKTFTHSEAVLKVDFDKNCLIYPEDQGLTIHERGYPLRRDKPARLNFGSTQKISSQDTPSSHAPAWEFIRQRSSVA